MQTRARKIWFIAFESKGVYKVGGLGEVAGSITRALASKNLRVALIMPSHGVARDKKLREKFKLTEVSAVDFKVMETSYRVTVYKGFLDNVDLYLFSGGNREAEKILENPVVYAEGVTESKAALLARSIHLLYEHGEWKPDVVHINDWHAVPAGIAIKLHAWRKGTYLPLLFQIHLYCGKWVDQNYLFNFCGIDPNDEIDVRLNGVFGRYTLEQIYSMSRGVLERLAAYVSDVIATVSESYLKRDEGSILQNIGFQFEGKSTYIYNGCDWELGEIVKKILESHGEKIGEFLGVSDLGSVDRVQLRKYLLEKALGELPENEPIIRDDYLAELIKELKGPIVDDKGKPLAFKKDGPLIITTGRTSVQKGIDVLLKAVPQILESYPEAKFLLLLLPVRGGESLIKEIFEEACKYPENVRVVYGVTPSIYHLAHVAATLYAAPSRWEPFGIMALEAMAVGTPLVASKVGGLSETILDLREHGLKGTGLLVPRDNPEELAVAIVSLISVMEERAEKVLYYELKALVSPGVAHEIRESCVRRVEENFRWSKVADMAINVYNKALQKVKGGG